ncbi:MAG: CocE/NonD family hydrolase [Steroidobacteraceae bacterium]
MLSGIRMAGFAVFLMLVPVPQALAQGAALEFHAPPSADDSTTAAVMRDLAERLLPVYQEPDTDRYLANLSILQMVAGDYAAADVSRQTLRNRRLRADAGRPVSRAFVFDIYAYAKTIEAENRVSFAEAFTRAFNEVVARLNDSDAYMVTRWLNTPPRVSREVLQNLLDEQRAKDSIEQSDAARLLREYLSFSAYRAFSSLTDALQEADDFRRYTVDESVLIKTPDGASIAAVVVRPRSPAKPLATLLELTIYDTQDNAKECAAHGYVGVVAYSRAKRANFRRAVPFQQDGDDAHTVINWIAKQPWSDGRVGMYGDGYSGFTTWAAASRLPSALKAIATSAATAPGINVPMSGNIFQNSAYRWSLYMTTSKASVEKSYDDDALWRALDQKWYRSGRRFRDLGRLHGQPDPLFIRWLNHPSYDRYWQKMIPFHEQFAHINIPVLTTTGYFAVSEPGALYYFTQHYRYNRHADHTLVIGPYDDAVMQSGPPAVLHEYQVDSTALVNLRELQYKWFDHVLKGAAAPSLLADRVNYEVMGANEWRHAPSIEAMAGAAARFYLDAAASGEHRRLTRHKPPKVSFVSQTVNFADRKDAGWMPPTDLITRSLVTHNDIMFESEPLTKPIEFSGLFSARLDFWVNKVDVDLNMMLFERLASGEYIRLFNPIHEFRASYARDRVNRRLLKAGERQELAFKSERMTSRRLQAGSRLVMVLGINKRPDREINYGTGNDVSEESIADGRIPLKIRWYGDSFIELPVRQ